MSKTSLKKKKKEKRKKFVLGITLNWWGSGSGALRSIAITLKAKWLGIIVYVMVSSICQKDLFEIILVWLGFLVQGHINLCGLWNAQSIPVKGLKWYYLTHNWGGDNGVHTFLKGIWLKVNVYIYQPLCTGKMWHKVNFLSGV